MAKYKDFVAWKLCITSGARTVHGKRFEVNKAPKVHEHRSKLNLDTMEREKYTAERIASRTFS
jgi:hypothetical protein